MKYGEFCGICRKTAAGRSLLETFGETEFLFQEAEFGPMTEEDVTEMVRLHSSMMGEP